MQLRSHHLRRRRERDLDLERLFRLRSRDADFDFDFRFEDFPSFLSPEIDMDSDMERERERFLAPFDDGAAAGSGGAPAAETAFLTPRATGTPLELSATLKCTASPMLQSMN